MSPTFIQSFPSNCQTLVVGATGSVDAALRRCPMPNAVLVTLHPGAVNSSLSQPFRGAAIGRSPMDAAADRLPVINSLTAGDTGPFIVYLGEALPWQPKVRGKLQTRLTSPFCYIKNSCLCLI